MKGFGLDMNIRTFPGWLLVLVLVLIGCGDVEAAKGYARTYATDLGFEVVGVACTGTDTDDDGYVSCSVRVKGDEAPLALECSRGTLTFATGCKQSQMMKARSLVPQVAPTPAVQQ